MALLATVASLLPARGVVATGFTYATTIAIGFLFFLYGARLSTRQAIGGLKHWRLHSVVLTPELYAGLMFLCCLPSTVQSSIAFTSIAKSNVAAAICSASLSNLIGIVLTPLLVALHAIHRQQQELSVAGLGARHHRAATGAVRGRTTAPALDRWFVTKHQKVLGYVDRSAIILVVYAAFSKGVVAGIWGRLPPMSLMLLLVVNIVLLTIVMMTTTIAAPTMA
jgi:solute carrier family 10 (sodium/bile acid cotransporter), member 7